MWSPHDIRTWYASLLTNWAGGVSGKDLTFLFDCDKAESSRSIRKNTPPIPPAQEDLLAIFASETMAHHAKISSSRKSMFPFLGSLRLQRPLYTQHAPQKPSHQISITEDFDAEIYRQVLLRKDVLEEILTAIIRGASVQISYQSRERYTEQRTVYPSKIRKIGGRFYMRAYEKNSAVSYKDFLLYRIVEAKIIDKNVGILERDAEYEEKISVKFLLNEQIPESYKAALRVEWNMGHQDRVLEFKNVRKCDVFFLNRKMTSESFENKNVWSKIEDGKI